MKSLNEVKLIGRMGKDPELRSTGGGTLVANLTLATDDRRKDAAGNWIDQTDWHNLTAFGRTAEIIRDYTQKGFRLYVSGKLKQESWDDKKTGEKKYRSVIIVNDLVLLDGKKDDRPAPSAPAAEDDDESGIPF